MEKGTTRLVGLIGWPVAHSLSPDLHNAAFAHLGLDWRYVLLPVQGSPPAALREAVLGLRALGFAGANVTVPHKRSVLSCLDRLSETARAIGAVNTIVVDEEQRLVGYNTDGDGFIADLASHGIDPRLLRSLVLGAGGSARAIVHGLARAGCPKIEVVNRTPARAHALARDFQGTFSDCEIRGCSCKSLAEAVVRSDLIVNCTPLGMEPRPRDLPWRRDASMRRGQLVYDLIYNPTRSSLLKKAEASSCQVFNGLGMLVRQAALAFSLWTKREAPLEVMLRAAGLDANRLRLSEEAVSRAG